MNSLLFFAQSSSTLSTAESIAVIILVLMFQLFVFTVIYVVMALLLMQLFKKAGLAQWPAWVPIYNNWKLFEIGGQQGFWAILMLVPVVNIVAAVFMFIAQYHIGLKLGKSGAFVLWAIFLPLVWFIWLAVDKSKWNEKVTGAAPSLAEGPRPARR